MVAFDSGYSGNLTKPVPKVTARTVSAYVPLSNAVCQKATLNDSAWECTVEASSPMPAVVSRTMWGEMRGILLTVRTSADGLRLGSGITVQAHNPSISRPHSFDCTVCPYSSVSFHIQDRPVDPLWSDLWSRSNWYVYQPHRNQII